MRELQWQGPKADTYAVAFAVLCGVVPPTFVLLRSADLCSSRLVSSRWAGCSSSSIMVRARRLRSVSEMLDIVRKVVKSKRSKAQPGDRVRVTVCPTDPAQSRDATRAL